MTTAVYLLDLVTQERFEFQHNPEAQELEFGHKAHFGEKNPKGSSHATLHYKHSDSDEFTLKLFWSRRELDASDVVQAERRLVSLTLGDYSDDGRLQNGPHPQRLVFGDYLNKRVIVKAVKIKPGPAFDATTLRPWESWITITFKEIPEADVSREDVRFGGA